MFKLAIYALVTIIPLSNCANILAILPTSSYSHQTAYYGLWKELSLRGHKVTLITTDPINDPKLTNLTEINMKHTYKALKNVTNVVEKKAGLWNVYELTSQLHSELSKQQLSHPQVQQLTHGKDRFNVVMVNFLFPEFLMFGKIYNCPTILLSSCDLPYYFYYSMGDAVHPVSHPDMVIPFHTPQNFRDRLLSTIYSLYTWYWKTYIDLPGKQRLIKNYFNSSIRIEQLIKDIDVVFLNADPVIRHSRALGPTTVSIGYERKPVSPTILPEDLKEFMDKARQGFIYFSLGSNIKSSQLDRNLLNTIMKTLKGLPYTFLYKYETDDLDNKPDNVKLIKWAPQYDVLRHPNIKLFITQGGFQSIEEAIYSTVPMVIIPFFYDQEHNARLMESKGIAKVVNRKPLRKNELANAIIEVYKNSSYRDSVKRLRELALDVPMTGLEKAIWWTEYVIRNKGAKHLRNPVADLPLYQYYLLDVIGFIVAMAVAFSVIVYMFIKTVFIKKMLKPSLMINKKVN